ncbi:MAG: response regulator transcription factor [Leptospiraceae bacterium]|nr:response regulator transcription factor [Leptospiraceae bacterium]MCP5497089.1 response regulator transcription factor [Leptospiraceae bacterium]
MLKFGVIKLKLIIVEDNEKLRLGLSEGFKKTGKADVIYHCGSGDKALEYVAHNRPDVILMDVHLAGGLNGIDTMVALRKEHPRLPVVFYSIQDADEYYRIFRNSGILTHFAYIKKSNYLLPEMLLPLMQDAIFGKSFIDPEIAIRVQEIHQKDENSPLNLLEPQEKKVALMLSKGYSNEQMAKKMGYKDKRTISRINGQIYMVWELNDNATDEKVARTRAALIVKENKLLFWEEDGSAYYQNSDGEWILWE